MIASLSSPLLVSFLSLVLITLSLPHPPFRTSGERLSLLCRQGIKAGSLWKRFVKQLGLSLSQHSCQCQHSFQTTFPLRESQPSRRGGRGARRGFCAEWLSIGRPCGSAERDSETEQTKDLFIRQPHRRRQGSKRVRNRGRFLGRSGGERERGPQVWREIDPAAVPVLSPAAVARRVS
jgi:hypothetical protein